MQKDLAEGLTADEIRNAIDAHVAQRPERVWSIGVTNSPERVIAGLIEQGASVATWNSWTALSLTAALEVERFYTQKGWRCGGAEHVRFRQVSFLYIY
jgi:hypothetical protein